MLVFSGNMSRSRVSLRCPLKEHVKSENQPEKIFWAKWVMWGPSVGLNLQERLRWSFLENLQIKQSVSWSDSGESCKGFTQVFTVSYKHESEFSHLRKSTSSISRWAKVACSDRNSHKQRQSQCVRATIKIEGVVGDGSKEFSLWLNIN